MTDRYKEAGVNIDAGNKFINNIKPLIKGTRQHGVLSDLGGFGALFAPNISDIKEPVLVSGTDGVGTKLKIAIELDVLDSVGIDLVAMCVNDIACSGAKPLFFLDYFATSRLDPERHTPIIGGIAKGCSLAKCALVGGETAEMSGFYKDGDFDLAGFAVGIVDRGKIIDGSEIGAGNAIVGLFSSGLHSNGYSLVNHIVQSSSLDLKKTYDGMEDTLGRILLTPTMVYSEIVEQLGRIFHIKGAAHITGGGFYDNIPRILPKGVQAVISKGSWNIPAIFRFIQHNAKMDDQELFRVFNCGIGMVLVVAAEQAEDLKQAASSDGFGAAIIGTTIIRPKGGAAVVIE